MICNKTWFSTKCNFLFTLILHNHIGSHLHVCTHRHTHAHTSLCTQFLFIFPGTQFLNLHFSILIDTSAYIIKILLREVFSQNCEWTCLDIKLLLKILSIYPLLLASFLLVHENLVSDSHLLWKVFRDAPVPGRGRCLSSASLSTCAFLSVVKEWWPGRLPPLPSASAYELLTTDIF